MYVTTGALQSVDIQGIRIANSDYKFVSSISNTRRRDVLLRREVINEVKGTKMKSISISGRQSLGIPGQENTPTVTQIE
jgi:hypothetical protein